MDDKIYESIIAKKEFSKLPKKDVEIAWKHFEKRQTSEEDKIKLTRDLLRRVFSVFTSVKLLNAKRKTSEWILKKHISTKERFLYYNEIYNRLLNNFNGTIIDLGCGVNGFSYNFFPSKLKYVGVEAIGQLVELTNNYFKKEKISGEVYHFGLFELEKIKNLIKKQRGEKIIFLLKVIDSLEMLEKDYSKKLLTEISFLADKIVVSFATRSLIRRKKFYANKKWFLNFIEENFKILDSFEFGSEKYLVFSKQ